jgi:Domain of unknown function (DUF4304)
LKPESLMNKTVVISAVQSYLLPLGFTKKGMTWNRKNGNFVDVVELQISKSADQITANIGVHHIWVHEVVWGAAINGAVDEPSCIFRQRLAELSGDAFVWWPLDSEETASSIVKAIGQHAMPLFDRMHSFDALSQSIAQGATKPYPLPVIYLSVLTHLSGHENDANSMLQSLKSRAGEAWRARIETVEVAIKKGIGGPK